MAFIGIASSARADLITVNANAYPLGTDLSNMFTGLSMSNLHQWGSGTPSVYNPIVSAVYASANYHDPNVMGLGTTTQLDSYLGCFSAGGASSSCGEGYSVMELRFAAPVDFVAVNFLWWSDAPMMSAYDALGNQIATGFGGTPIFTGTGYNGGSSSMMTLARGQADIARVVYGGAGGNATPTAITYRVPEPGTLGLMAVGLLAAWRRRRTSVAQQSE